MGELKCHATVEWRKHIYSVCMGNPVYQKLHSPSHSLEVTMNNTNYLA